MWLGLSRAAMSRSWCFPPGAGAWEEHQERVLSDLPAQPGLCVGSVVTRKQQV